ncbi:MAG TPA: sulfurtransferase TusE [Halieaceae bacterium]|nr:sulfurtransferase TusE [Halieaceae bacterium]HCJ38933.1 sulfurtransferase TusE [Halieaceae bacterium]
MTTQTHNFKLDKHGFLADRTLWDQDVARVFAEFEGLTLTDAHWEIIGLIRDYFLEFDASPANRALVKYVRLKLGADKGNSIYLMRLFPGSPTRVASRIAGLPKPKNCF